MSTLHSLLLVMTGGALGAGARFLLGSWLLRQLGSGFPWGTFGVNILGSFAAGALLVYLQKPDAAPWLRPLLMTGLLGGLTTYSALMVDCLLLWHALDKPALAVGYLALTLIAGVLALLIGWQLGQSLGV